MGIRNLVEKNDPVLRYPASKVKNIDRVIQRILDDMVDTMRYAEGIGLAAPQIGISKRIIVAAPEEGEVVKLINPHISSREGEEVGLEGCLSLPGVYGEVPRSQRVKIKGTTPEGETTIIEADGLLARVLQHEIDHLFGVLFTDKATRLVDPEELKSEG